MGGPYASTIASLGGLPTPSVDIPITSIFLVFYLAGAATNMTIFQLNNRRQHKFLISAALFGFCMSRIVTCVIRIVLATRQHNVRLAIAAGIFNNAGVLILYVVNLLLAQRIVRALQPKLGWSRPFSMAFKVCYALVGALLVMVITTLVISSYTLDVHTKMICADCQKVAGVMLLVIAVLPYAQLGLAFLLPRSHEEEVHFGQGSVGTKALILLATTTLAATIAGFKAGANLMPPRPINNPAWYQSKEAFYLFGFSLEICILTIFDLSRVDKRFHVPNGSSKAKTFRQEEVSAKEGRSSVDTVQVGNRIDC